MRYVQLAAAGAMLCTATTAYAASNACKQVTGDVVIGARTPQVDLYDSADGHNRVSSIDKGAFPTCTPVAARAPNMMLQITVNNAKVWVPPHMVTYRLGGKKPSICRNLAMGSDQAKVGSTRALGEDCPKPGSKAP